MRFLNAKAHIALGQTFLLTSLLLGAVALGLIPDRQSAVREGRAALSEAIAISGSRISRTRKCNSRRVGSSAQ